MATADLCDAHGDRVRVVEPMFIPFGGLTDFEGTISTVKCHEDNTLVRSALEEPGNGRVLVVDGGGSLRCALVGDQLAALGMKNGWAGVVVYGCIRDSEVIDGMDIGLRALTTNPRRSVKKNAGDRDIPVTFGGVTFVPGHYLYADADGVIVADEKLD